MRTNTDRQERFEPMAEKSFLQRVLEDAGYECRSYSGRGMFGRECLGVSLDRYASEFALIADVLANMPVSSDGETMEDSLDTLAKAFRGANQDQIGLGTIVYWPAVPYVGDENDDNPPGEDD